MTTFLLKAIYERVMDRMQNTKMTSVDVPESRTQQLHTECKRLPFTYKFIRKLGAHAIVVFQAKKTCDSLNVENHRGEIRMLAM